MTKHSNFLLAAPASGTGKTTLTLALLRALKNRGLAVQPFKCGPDYIDTKFHHLASGNRSINLDLFLSSEIHVQDLFDRYGQTTDVSIVEGVMGLFDGYDRMKGSSAEVASALDVPVVLVVNAKASAYSVAPLIEGFKNFLKGVRVIGAIFNFVASESHYRFLQEACLDIGVEPLGYFPKNEALDIPSRHLGLSLDSISEFNRLADHAASLAEKYIAIDRLLEITRVDRKTVEAKTVKPGDDELVIAVAHDEAFNFMYHENIESFKRLGKVVYFSPLQDKAMPEADLVYLPGGYPELYAQRLSENKEMLASIKEYAENFGAVLAECGGMMYLSRAIIDSDGKEYPMVGVLNQTATMQKMKLRLGYRQFNYQDVPFKGHEFHYSSVLNPMDSLVDIYNARGVKVDTPLVRYKNVLAGYTHLYWAEHDHIFQLFK